MQCPKCMLENPPGSEKCDCGYDFLRGCGGTSPRPMKAKQILSGWQIFFLSLLVFIGYRNFSSSGDSKEIPSAAEKTLIEKKPFETDAKASLFVTDFHWSSEYGWAKAEGRVKNVSLQNMRNVMAVVTWETKDGSFITSESALIEYNPILPDQLSPFKVMATYNPAMERANLEFKSLLGSTIPYDRQEKAKTIRAKK
jgi:hypothetical protein